MKHIIFSHCDKIALRDALLMARDREYKSTLIQIYTGLTKKREIQSVIDDIATKFPLATIIGATTAGEIAHAKIKNNTTTISISFFDKTELKLEYASKIDRASGKMLSQSVCSKHTKASIILSEGLNGKDYAGFLKGFKDTNPDIIVSGGLAGDNFRLKKTYIIVGDKIYKKGSVALSFSGKELYADNQYNLNWTPIGKKFTITKSKGNTVYEIDNISAVKIFKKYLGSHLFKNNSKILSDFQLLYQNGSTTVARTPMARDGDAIVLASPIKEGQKVQFGFSNAPSVISGSNEIVQEIKHKPAEAIYLFSCIARKKLLGDMLEDEFANFNNLAPVGGFFTYGEYYSTSLNNEVLNCTSTLLILSEKSSQREKIHSKVSTKESLEDTTFKSLTHFIKQTSNELASNIQLLNQYKDAVDASLLVSKTDLNGNITFVNDNFCVVSKYTRGELIGQPHNIIRSKNSSSFTFKKMWNTIKSSKVWRGELENRAKDGSPYYINATIMPIHNEDGIIEEYIAIRQDITKQILSKQKMKAKEKFIKAMFDAQESIVLYSSAKEGMLNVNKTFFDHFEYDNFEDFKSQHNCICDLFIEEDGYLYPKKNRNWQELISQDENQDYKVKMLANDGEVHTYTLSVKKIDSEYLLNLSDISNLEKALKKAYLSEQAKSIFLANMSHEIRTPLNGILGFTDILTKMDLDDTSKHYIDIIHKSGETLLNVVNDILDFSKIESGELSLSKTGVEFKEEMSATLATFDSVAKSKEITFHKEIDADIPTILNCDIQRIRQVLNNLISNAIKFTPTKGSVDVNISLQKILKSKATLLFSIKDSGIGIEKNNIATIFKPFSQADDSISREFGGTGLGLAISGQYIEIMGSKIKIKSKKDVGSEFSFELILPIIDISIQPTTKRTNSQQLFKGNILVAEDNETNQMLISIMLRDRGIDFKVVQNGQEAVDEALNGNYDIVLMDINMPIMDGLSATKILRESGYKSAIVSLSADVIEENLDSFIDAGVDETLHKPVVPSNLDRVLSKYLDFSDNIDAEIEDFDILNLDFLAKELFIKDIDVVKSLLKSFKSSAMELLIKLQNDGLQSDNLHTIKGLSGNLRLTKLYKRTLELEDSIDNFSVDKNIPQRDEIIAHLEKAIENIEKL